MAIWHTHQDRSGAQWVRIISSVTSPSAIRLQAVALITAVARSVGTFLWRKRARLELLDLTAEQLRDVGLTKHDVARSVAHSTAWRDPRHG